MARSNVGRRRKTRDNTRAARIFGTGEDKNAFYRCNHCNSIVGVKNNPGAFKGLHEPHGSITSVPTTAGTVTPYEYNTKLIGEMNHATVILTKRDAAGDEPVEYEDYDITSTGCPLCGHRGNRI